MMLPTLAELTEILRAQFEFERVRANDNQVSEIARAISAYYHGRLGLELPAEFGEPHAE